MRLFISKFNSYCYGVQDAVNLIKDNSSVDKKLTVYGDLIHNKEAINYINKTYNVDSIPSDTKISDIKDKNLVIRAHGIGADDLNSLKKQNNKIIDATCSFVSKTHNLIKNIESEDRFIFIIGKRNHPEVLGIAGHINSDQYCIVYSNDDLKGIKRKGKTAILFQSTVMIENFSDIISNIISLSKETKVYNTICNVTKVRQSVVLDLIKEVDCMVIIGGRNSSNTKQLSNISRRMNIPTFQIENYLELPVNIVADYSKLGIISGTSTAQFTIDCVIMRLHSIYLNRIKNL